MDKEPIDLSALRTRLAGATGKRFWRCLEELADTREFQEFLHREFPRGAAEFKGAISRRSFLKLMAASFALAGLSGCAVQPPREKIVPYADQPDPRLVPGKPLFFASAMPMGGYGTGLLVESHLGRPTKIEGNPVHPASLGATDVFAQAAVLSLYDPDRAQAITTRGQPGRWSDFLAALNGQLQSLGAGQGAGLRILTETVTSPTMTAQIQALIQNFPQARWHHYDPVGLDNVRAGARLAFGQVVNPTYNFAAARRILALDSDFLNTLPGKLRYAREFIDGRRLSAGLTDMNRLYVVESTLTITGAMADHRVALRASGIEGFARALAQALGVASVGAATPPAGIPAGWIEALVRDLQGQRGASIVIAGEHQPPIVHALAHAINQALDNVGTTVVYTAPAEANPEDQLPSLRQLADDMAAGQVSTLLIFESNPALTAPADFDFANRLRQVPFSVHLSLYYDETSALSQWHIPQAHFLEAWGDVRAYNGTATIMQPLIAPLYEGKTSYELLAALNGNAAQSSYDIVRAYWQGRQGGATPATPTAGTGTGAPSDFDQFWQQALNDGIVAGTELAPAQVTVSGDLAATPAAGSRTPGREQTLEIVFRPDPSIWDGRFANNAWLQELPRPLTTLTWDNAALISPRTAIQRLGLAIGDINNLTEQDYEELSKANGQLVDLQLDGRTITAPILILAGHADDSITLHLGYGRTRAGQVGNGVGVNAYTIRPSNALNFGTGLELRATGGSYPLATTQRHFSVEGRDIVRIGTLEEYRAEPEFLRNEADEFLPRGRPQEDPQSGEEAPQGAPVEPAEGAEEHNIPSLYPEYTYNGYAWGMAIDTNACIGCNACTIACQAENNIPVVGKEQVDRSREMHWIKIDTYFDGALGNPGTTFQPRPCMHCEKAPCEVVCPVVATAHDNEGLNQMIYNRCVGTRYCSNNCPYKVRRFNYLSYKEDIPVINLVHNPDVTVRDRGVMEKCTYCVQRIEHARINAKREERTIQDGEILTACQQVCPTNAIVFGNINDPNSAVSRLKALPLNFGMLAELGTQPRTSYLGRISNPNPEIQTE